MRSWPQSWLEARQQAVPGKQAVPEPQTRSAHGDGPPVLKGSTPLQCSPCTVPSSTFALLWCGPRMTQSIFLVFRSPTATGWWYLTNPGDNLTVFVFDFFVIGGGLLRWGGFLKMGDALRHIRHELPMRFLSVPIRQSPHAYGSLVTQLSAVGVTVACSVFTLSRVPHIGHIICVIDPHFMT